MKCLKHFLLYNGKSFQSKTLSAPYVFDLQCVKYRKYGVPVLLNQSFDIGYADIEIAPLNQRDEIGIALYADIHVNSDKLPEKYTVGLDIHIDERHYIHPGVELAINKDKWITTSPGSWLVTDATVNAIIITEGETLTWLIDGGRNTITQPEQKTEEKEMEHTQTESYDLSQPICENPQLALDALKQIIQANKDGNNETAIFMTVKQCQKCGEWPTCRLDSDGQDVAIIIECSQNTDNQWAIASGSETVKDLIRTWNHLNSNPFMEDRETRNKKSETEIACTQQQIDSYSMAVPISQDVHCALAVLKQTIQANMQDSCIATLPIKRCPQCNALPTCRLDDKSTAIIMECVKDGRQHSYYCSRSNDSLTKIIIEWNKVQDIVRNTKSVKDKKFDDYDWDVPINIDDKLLADVVQHCLKQQETGNGTTKMHICLCKDCCQPPMVFNKERQGNTFFGCDNPKHASIPINANMSLTEVVQAWNELQGVPTEKTENEPPAKTIEELEAEADRGLSKPEDIQKLKEANVLTDSQKAIAEVCDEIKELLLEKNRKYGDSALNPCRIFARSDRLEQIRVRIDDKLNRIKNEQGDEDEDVVKDLIGYLVLYEIAKRMDDND